MAFAELHARAPASSTTPGPRLYPEGVRMIIINVIFVVLATIAVALRFIARRMKRTSFFLEDYLILLALFVFYGVAVAQIIGLSFGGAAPHLRDMGPVYAERFLRHIFALWLLLPILLALTKCSICVMLIRLFFVRKFKIAARIVMGFCIAQAVVSVLLGLLICSPIWKFWKYRVPGRCGNKHAAVTTMYAVNILSEILIWCLPIPMVWKLKVPRRHKIALGSVFALGLLSIVMACVRLVITSNFVYSNITYRQDTPNSVIVEPSTGIMVACAPLLRPIFDKVFPRTSLSRRRQSVAYSGNPARVLATDDLESLKVSAGNGVPMEARAESNSSTDTRCSTCPKPWEVDRGTDHAPDDAKGICVKTRLDVQWAH